MGRRHWTIIALGLALVAALGTLSVAVAQSQSATLTMASQNNSGITGTATLTETGGGKMKVEIKATGSGAGPQPAHIHEGTCAQLNPAPKFPLSPVTNGASTSEIDASLQALTASPHAIHMHKSPEEIPVYVACADIKLASGTLPRAGEDGSLTGILAALSGVGLALAGAGYVLRRRVS